jgi:hypothetical protein
MHRSAFIAKAGERAIPRLRRRLGWFARNFTAGEAILLRS